MNATDGQGNGEEVQPFANATAQRVAKIYAEGLFDAAQKASDVDGVLEQLRSFIDDVLKSQPDFEHFLASAAVARERKEEVLRQALEGRASEPFLNFMLLLNEHDRLELLRPIRAAAEELNDRRANRVRVLVQTAVPLPDDQRERLIAELRDLMHIEPVLETRVDPELLGGMVVRLRDWLYDASVRTQLDKLRTELIERGSHEIQSRRDRLLNL